MPDEVEKFPGVFIKELPIGSHPIEGVPTWTSKIETPAAFERRLFDFVQQGITRATAWAVFEPNAEPLWANARRESESFLFALFQQGALQGDRPERAYFVKCDRSTMTQADIDAGRLIVLVGIAPLRPAEFDIIRIQQQTAQRPETP